MKVGIMTDTHHGFSELQDKKNVLMLKEMAEFKPDLIIHSGDIGSHCYENRRDFVVELRKMFPDLPVIAVLGNHCYWHNGVNKTFSQLCQKNTKLLKDNNIIELNGDNDFTYEKVYFCGFGGWYSDLNPPTNDKFNIPQYDTVGKDYLYSQSHKQFSKCLAHMSAYKAEVGFPTVLVSHFPFVQGATDWKSDKGSYFGNNLKYEEFLFNTDYFIFGHTHSSYTGVANNGKTKCINVGSNYEDPKFLILEIEITKVKS